LGKKAGVEARLYDRKEGWREGGVLKKAKIGKRTQIYSSRRGKVTKTKPKTNPNSGVVAGADSGVLLLHGCANLSRRLQTCPIGLGTID
jgi:hypothetical protein